MKKIFFVAFIFIISLFACKTDFEINAKWKDIMIVYGLLNQNDTTHYIKIGKAFLGEGNALAMAQNPDSSSYGNNLEVWVEEWKNGSQSKVWYLDTTTIYNKEPGVFYNTKQVLYRFLADNLDENAEYKLFIKNKLTGKIVSSVTPLVHTFSIEKPSSIQTAVFHATNPVIVKWYSSLNGKRYQVVIRFNYWEKNLDNGDSTKRYVDWDLGSYKSGTTEGNEIMTTTYYGNSFFQYLRDKINSSSNVPVNVLRRLAVPNVEFIFSVAADDFNTYMEVNAPSTSIVQEKPEYTNISNGIGIFSSRFSIDRRLAMSPYSIDSLLIGVYTKDLHFLQ